MLRLTPTAFAAAMSALEREGAARLRRVLDAEAEARLLEALTPLPYLRAAEQINQVRQDFDVLKANAADGWRGLPPLLDALRKEYGALFRQHPAARAAGLTSFQPNEVHVQRYRPGSQGITAHRDQRRYVNLVSIFSLGAPARFVIYKDRAGTVKSAFEVSGGDLVLLSAPDFAGTAHPGPIHAVEGPRESVRYSVSLREEAPAAPIDTGAG